MKILMDKLSNTLQYSTHFLVSICIRFLPHPFTAKSMQME